MNISVGNTPPQHTQVLLLNRLGINIEEEKITHLIGSSPLTVTSYHLTTNNNAFVRSVHSKANGLISKDVVFYGDKPVITVSVVAGSSNSPSSYTLNINEQAVEEALQQNINNVTWEPYNTALEISNKAQQDSLDNLFNTINDINVTGRSNNCRSQ